MKAVPQADAKSASMGWFFDPGFIQNVQRVASDIENPSMESIDSVLFALREMGYIKTASTCEHGFSVDECVTGICELQTEHAALRARLAEVEAQRDGLKENLELVTSLWPSMEEIDNDRSGAWWSRPSTVYLLKRARKSLAKLEANDGK